MTEESFIGGAGRIKTPSDLLAREHYVATLEVNDPELSEVLEPYHFDYEYPCGRAGCGRGHKEGFLVKVASGEETNIGWLCGKRIFGNDFAIKANAQLGRARLTYQMDMLNGARNQKDHLLQRIGELINRRLGIKWASKTQKSFNEIVGAKTVRALHDRAKRGNAIVSLAREATGPERDTHKAKFPTAKPLQYVEEKLGIFSGLEFFNNDLDRTANELKDKIYELSRIELATLAPQKRKVWVDWVTSIDRVFDQIEQGLADSLRFFNQANLELALALNVTKPLTVGVRWSPNEFRFIAKK